MTCVPPFEMPSDHDNPICELAVIDGTFTKFIGASGIVNIIAPVPSGDAIEGP